MELRQLRYFVTVADELNFGRAARRLHITQPGVSQGIKVLEREFGLTLFERNRQHVVLTPAGATLLPVVRKLLAQVDEVGQLVSQLACDKRGRLALSHTRSAGIGLPYELTAGFRRVHAEIAVHTSIGFTSANVDKVRSREVDVAFVRPPLEAGNELRCMVIAREPVVLAVHAEHRLAGAVSVRSADLTEEPLVYFPQEAGGLWSSMLNQVYGTDRHPDIVRVEPDEPHMLAAVAEGAGISLVTESAAMMLNVPGVVIKKFAESVTVPLGIVWRADNSNPTLRSFLSFIYESLGSKRTRPLAS